MIDLFAGEVNYLAILLCAVAAQALGALWYMVLWGKAWVAARGYTDEDLAASSNAGYAIAFVCVLVEAYILSRVLDWVGASGWIDGLILGIVIWVGFVATTMATQAAFNPRPSPKAWLIESGYQLKVLAVSGIILGLFQP